jgi:hypothetical protein
MLQTIRSITHHTRTKVLLNLVPQSAPFDLGASRAIYSPLTESHTSINSSSAAEEQRSLRDTILEIRVVLVV